jgi:sugar/nucleoside kinase (ribokinase family)
MAVDILILNTAVVDFRSSEFAFADKLVGAGGLAKCKTQDMPDYDQPMYRQWIDDGAATAGGPGNTAPLIARAGIRVGVAVNLGKGDYDGLDAQGRYFHDTMIDNNVDMSQCYIHPKLPTGTTFIYEKGDQERGGIAYFPNANNDFDFEYCKGAVENLDPGVVYYMYSGLSDSGDANEGKDLAEFMAWCRNRGIVTIADSHTLTGNPQELIQTDAEIKEYKLLEPLLSELDLFFTSYDEARMIENTLGQMGLSRGMSENDYIAHFLDFLADRFWKKTDRSGMFGVTVSNGAFEKHIDKDGISVPAKIESNFMMGQVMDLVGAGDSFRAGFISYIARNIEAFKTKQLDFSEAVQMGNLFASLYIKAPLNDRYRNIGEYNRMLGSVSPESNYRDFDQLIMAVKGK